MAGTYHSTRWPVMSVYLSPELRSALLEADGQQCAYCQTRTDIGRVTIIGLNMNNAVIVSARRRWVQVGWHPPQ